MTQYSFDKGETEISFCAVVKRKLAMSTLELKEMPKGLLRKRKMILDNEREIQK